MQGRSDQSGGVHCRAVQSGAEQLGAEKCRLKWREAKSELVGLNGGRDVIRYRITR